ncbi:hypothetical protein B0A50_01385 [Salinomyces thailandicus]|uniref:Uncharacterized protein n=1 Tax=Salinomyces thailandicus TaxID=706561 RepID=A0A4U0UAG6_9PEZI|nr:hypothetical protein B0A50_01385 [Salinomyces thailandica]
MYSTAATTAMPARHQPSVKHEADAAILRPLKRRRLAADQHPIVHERTAQDDTALEVDIMILDYLAHQAIHACIASRSPSSRRTFSLSHNLAMTDSFLALLTARHPHYALDADLRFRLQLLQLTALFTQRLTRNPTTPPIHALQHLREQNSRRAHDWLARTQRFIPSQMLCIPTVSQANIDRNRAYTRDALDVPHESGDAAPHYGTSSSVSLLDLLPLFMRVSAARQALLAATTPDSGLTLQWMHLACEFMVQACLEQGLERRVLEREEGKLEVEVINEAFAWGYASPSSSESKEQGEEGEEQHKEASCDEVNDMFEDPVYETEIEDWSELKRTYLARLTPDAHSRTSDADTNDAIARPLPLATFEQAILTFLQALAESLERPVLVQLEEGRLEGFSREATEELARDWGVEELLGLLR